METTNTAACRTDLLGCSLLAVTPSARLTGARLGSLERMPVKRPYGPRTSVSAMADVTSGARITSATWIVGTMGHDLVAAQRAFAPQLGAPSGHRSWSPPV